MSFISLFFATQYCQYLVSVLTNLFIECWENDKKDSLKCVLSHLNRIKIILHKFSGCWLQSAVYIYHKRNSRNSLPARRILWLDLKWLRCRLLQEIEFLVKKSCSCALSYWRTFHWENISALARTFEFVWWFLIRLLRWWINVVTFTVTGFSEWRKLRLGKTASSCVPVLLIERDSVMVRSFHHRNLLICIPMYKYTC